MKELEKLLRRTLPETVALELIYTEAEYIVMADLTRLQQVFMNLAVNARDAMLEGGTLRFQLAFAEFAEGEQPVVDMSPGKWIQVSVSDTGMGIQPENLSHIFEPFFTTKPVGQGTGLGLAQVYGIVRQHEGFIDVKSQPGVGTQFDIYLPLLSSWGRDNPGLVAQSQVDGAGETALVVEDDATTLAALQALLDAHNFNVLIASNGVEAIKQLETQNYEVSLVISDIVMPEMGGLNLYYALKAKKPDIKMIFITGHPLDGAAQDLLEHGAVIWLQKPFSITEFNDAVRKVFA